MSKAHVMVNNILAGLLEELPDRKYYFNYHPEYTGAPVAQTIPLNNPHYEFDQFPPFFEGLIEKGPFLEKLLNNCDIDKFAHFRELLQIGQHKVGAVNLVKCVE